VFRNSRDKSRLILQQDNLDTAGDWATRESLVAFVKTFGEVQFVERRMENED
jgi:hypothetical protein